MSASSRGSTGRITRSLTPVTVSWWRHRVQADCRRVGSRVEHVFGLDGACRRPHPEVLHSPHRASRGLSVARSSVWPDDATSTDRNLRGGTKGPGRGWTDMAGGDREKALDVALAQIEKQFGKGSVMRLGDETRAPLEVIPTGSI